MDVAEAAIRCVKILHNRCKIRPRWAAMCVINHFANVLPKYIKVKFGISWHLL